MIYVRLRKPSIYLYFQNFHSFCPFSTHTPETWQAAGFNMLTGFRN